jgi:hypothetical protein
VFKGERPEVVGADGRNQIEGIVVVFIVSFPTYAMVEFLNELLERSIVDIGNSGVQVIAHWVELFLISLAFSASIDARSTTLARGYHQSSPWI